MQILLLIEINIITCMYNLCLENTLLYLVHYCKIIAVTIYIFNNRSKRILVTSLQSFFLKKANHEPAQVFLISKEAISLIINNNI